MNIEILIQYGIDYNDGLKRFIGNSDLYQMLLLEFLRDEEYAEAEKSLKAKDYQAAFNHFHTLKGVVGNLSMTELYKKCCVIVEKLRYNDYVSLDKCFLEFEATYHRVYEGIILAKGE